MITTTTPSIEGRQIKAYLGIVVGEAIVGGAESGQEGGGKPSFGGIIFGG